MAEQPIEAAQENGDSSSEHLEVEGLTEGGWIQWFCSLEGNEFIVEIEEDYIRDPFNLYGLKHKFEASRFKYSKHYIILIEIAWNLFFPLMLHLNMIYRMKRKTLAISYRFLELSQDASDIYGMIHARFILSPRGKRD